jgi:hypothetical protein
MLRQWLAAQTNGAKRAGGIILGHIFLAIVIGVVGIFFLASGFQTSPEDFSWFRRFCYTGVCIHPEWIAVGAGLIAGAFVVFLVLKPEHEDHWP